MYNKLSDIGYCLKQKKFNFVVLYYFITTIILSNLISYGKSKVSH